MDKKMYKLHYNNIKGNYSPGQNNYDALNIKKTLASRTHPLPFSPNPSHQTQTTTPYARKKH